MFQFGNSRANSLRSGGETDIKPQPGPWWLLTAEPFQPGALPGR